jgi:hypothetical protein
MAGKLTSADKAISKKPRQILEISDGSIGFLSTGMDSRSHKRKKCSGKSMHTHPMLLVTYQSIRRIRYTET